MPRSKKQRPSSTLGRSKGDNCHKSDMKNRYAKDTRWYRTDPVGYAAACEKINQYKGNNPHASKFLYEEV